MRVHAKTRPTKKTRKAASYIRYQGRRIPLTEGQLRKVLKTIRYKPEPGIPWRKAMADLIDGNEGGVMLRGHRLRKGLTQTDLAEMIGEEQSNISSMEKGTRAISKEMARKLGYALNVDYRVFL